MVFLPLINWKKQILQLRSASDKSGEVYLAKFAGMITSKSESLILKIGVATAEFSTSIK